MIKSTSSLPVENGRIKIIYSDDDDKITMTIKHTSIIVASDDAIEGTVLWLGQEETEILLNSLMQAHYSLWPDAPLTLHRGAFSYDLNADRPSTPQTCPLL